MLIQDIDILTWFLVYSRNNGGIFAKHFTPTADGIEVMWMTHVVGKCPEAY